MKNFKTIMAAGLLFLSQGYIGQVFTMNGAPSVQIQKSDTQSQKYVISKAVLDAIKNNDDVRAMSLWRSVDFDPNFKDEAGNTALMYAARFGNQMIVEHLLTLKSLRVDIRNNNGQTARDLVVNKKGTIDFLLKRAAKK